MTEQDSNLPRVAFERVSVRSFRNIATLEFEPSRRFNFISGDNGQGKTSLLEALYFVATSKSFRTEQAVELVQQNAPLAVVRATVQEAGERREQRAVLTGGRRALSVDGKKPPNTANYATRTPVVAFHPADLGLVAGPASERRRLLDRLALFIEPPSVQARLRYKKALRARQRTLEQRGVGARELDAFEALAADEGARVARARARAAQELVESLAPAFELMAAPDLNLTARYQPGGSEDIAEFRAELERRRPRDLARKSASFGPQRDELLLCTEGRSAREHASQGQQRILTLAIKAAELSVIRRYRRAQPVLLLDDVSSELDPGRTGAVYRFLRDSDSQIFVTTTRPALFAAPSATGERADWTLEKGTLTRA